MVEQARGEVVMAADERSPTDVRFSTRALLFIMAVVAVAATALGAFVRSFPPDRQLSVAVYWCILVVIIIGVTIYHARRRFVAERQAGRVLCVLPTHSYLMPRVPWIGTALVGAFFVALGPAMWIGNSVLLEQSSLMQAVFNWGTYCGASVTGMGITMLWWRNVRLTEHGIVVRSEFITWESSPRWYWDACNKNVLVIENKIVGRVAAQVPEENRADMQSRMDEKVPRKK